jgi:hypothetical protein
MMIMSSLKRNGLAANVSASCLAVGLSSHTSPFAMNASASPPSTVIRCTGFCRYRNSPCGPEAPNSTPSGKTLPVRASRLAAATFAGVMKFSVPTWSSSPQRPQFEIRFAALRKSAIVAIVSLLLSVVRRQASPPDAARQSP